MKKLILWLCRVFEVHPLDEARILMGDEAKARSHRWEAFAREDGGLFDMIEGERRKAFEAYSALPPDAHDERVYLAMSDRNWRALEARVRSVITAGKIEERNEARKAPSRILKSV